MTQAETQQTETQQTETQVAGFRFDSFYLDAQNRQLYRDGEPLALNSKYFDVLLLLVSRNGQLVEKRRIFDEVWQGVFVTDAALTQCIKDIRKQLGDDATRPRFIKTVPRHGYIFIGNAVEAKGSAARPSRAPIAADVVALARPYKFLDYFTEQDAQIFFGREPEVETICSQILAHRSFILHGRSGVGKSSIVRAGLLPLLKSEGHSVFVIRCFTDPSHQIVAAMAETIGGGHTAESLALEEIVARFRESHAGRAIIIFIDQFEEFFSLLGEETKQRFLNCIRDVISDETLPFHMVFVLREDLLAEMSYLKGSIPEIYYHEYRLKRLSREQAARAITEPARAAGCEYQPQLVTRLLDDLGDEEGVDPPQLQIVCDSLYDAREPTGELTLAVYEQLGTASQILAGYLERVLRRFNSADLRAAREVLTSLISADGERRVLRESELFERATTRLPHDTSRLSHLIGELVAARVVRRRSQDGEPWLELAHDFLTPEVSRWLSADEVALKRARGIVERAMENYRAHELIIDADALELLLPFGEQLGLTGEEADLLMTSTLNRGVEVPDWLARSAPRAATLIVEAGESADPAVRLRTVEAALLLGDEPSARLLTNLSLRDRDHGVRKAATRALADWFGPEAEARLSAPSQTEKTGLVRRGVSLAMIRDYDKRLVRFSHLPITLSLLVFFGLVWVRLRRNAHEIIKQTVGGTLGGAVSGIVGGLMLGLGLSMAQRSAALDTISLTLVLISMGAFIGAIGGMGVSLGMIVLSHLAYRHSRWWSVVGGTAGGVVVGGSSKLLGVDTLRALFGQSPTGLTGAFEGAVIGAGVALGAVLSIEWIGRARTWHKVLGASLGAMCAGVVLTVIGGNLFSGSLEIVARSFADSQMRLEPLAPFFGEVHFGQTTQIIFGAIEGLIFGAGMTAGIEAFARAYDKSRGDRISHFE
jgi:DNA-binding winged helix-turn-helix (wHTH) protein